MRECYYFRGLKATRFAVAKVCLTHWLKRACRQHSMRLLTKEGFLFPVSRCRELTAEAYTALPNREMTNRPGSFVWRLVFSDIPICLLSRALAEVGPK